MSKYWVTDIEQTNSLSFHFSIQIGPREEILLDMKCDSYEGPPTPSPCQHILHVWAAQSNQSLSAGFRSVLPVQNPGAWRGVQANQTGTTQLQLNSLSRERKGLTGGPCLMCSLLIKLVYTARLTVSLSFTANKDGQERGQHVWWHAGERPSVHCPGRPDWQSWVGGIPSSLV